jgi:hypothetical protein
MEPTRLISSRSIAPGMTLIGITTALAVMLMCFGPGVFYLFVRRARRLRGLPAGLQPAE